MFVFLSFLLVGSLVCGTFLIVKPEIVGTFLNRSVTRRQVAIGVIVYLIICLPLLFLILQGESPVGNFPPSVSTSPLRAPTLLPTSSVKKVGLGVTRGAMIEKIQSEHPEAVFRSSSEVLGQEAYTAMPWTTTKIVLVGPEANLTQIMVSEALADNADDILSSLLYVIPMAQLVDPNAEQWVRSVILEANTRIANGETSITKFTILHERRYEFSLQNAILMLTVRSARE
jgi:hypothetical protein